MMIPSLSSSSSSSSSSPYIPLPHTGDFIRLLALEPGSHSAPLVGRFLIHNLNDAQPEYTATSYVCGDDDRSRHSICMMAGPPNQDEASLGIYKNADEVLRRFRSPSETIFLWIDVVSIDQENPVEKAREVNLMYKVYQNARQTVIWLGPEDEDSRQAVEFARSLDAESYLKEFIPVVQYMGYETQYLQRKSHILDVLNTHPEKEKLTNVCATFLLRPWFTRVWTQQEGAMSSEPTVVCGDDEILWANIFALAWLFRPRSTMSWASWFLSHVPRRYASLEPNLDAVNNIQRYRLRQMLIRDQAPSMTVNSLLNNVRSASRQQCFDPRDKIYAVLNMASDVADWGLQPDYVTPWEHVYTDLGVRMAEKGDQRLLAWSGICQQKESSSLPSWVVDWRSFPRVQYINHTEWCAGSKGFRGKAERVSKRRQHYLTKLLPASSQPCRPPRYALQVTLVMQDTIRFLSGVLQTDNIDSLHPDIVSLDQRNQRFINTLPSPRYITSEPNGDAYSATLIANTTDQDTIASPPYIIDGLKEWRDWIGSGAAVKDDTMPTFHAAVDNTDVFRLKHFCITSRGYFCLVPDIAEPTDTVAIVKGLDMPVVLRPIGDYYVHVGQSYVHGMMELQAGTLIEEFQVRIKDGSVVIGRPQGEIRRNGLKADHGEYVRILETLGERKVDLI